MHRNLNGPPHDERNPKTRPITFDSCQKGQLCMPKTLPRRKEGTKIYRHQPHPPANQRDNPSNKTATDQKQNNTKKPAKQQKNPQNNSLRTPPQKQKSAATAPPPGNRYHTLRLVTPTRGRQYNQPHHKPR